MADSRVAQKIISKCGGASALAELLDYPRSTVNNWINRDGGIPAKQQSVILAAAIKNGIDLKPEDFFQLPPPKKRNGKHANGAP
jgi:DNA-binding transcriptional regulator YdaS (Cro superfamily)